MEFLTIYLGPTLVFIGWFWLLRKMVRIGRAQRITSIADMISSRYGKSGGLAALVTVLAVLGTTPYIALQLQSVTLSFEVFARPGALGAPDTEQTAVWVAAGLALFTIVFGTRSLDVNERHPGLVSAIALEAIVKLFAILGVGVFVVWGVADGPSDMLDRIEASPVSDADWNGARWLGLTALSAFAILCLAAHVPGAGGGKLRRAAPRDGGLGLSALPAADQPFRGAHRRDRPVGARGRQQPRPFSC